MKHGAGYLTLHIDEAEQAYLHGARMYCPQSVYTLSEWASSTRLKIFQISEHHAKDTGS